MINRNKILITSALPYVNNIPHLGNIIGCVLPADVIARYHRLNPNNEVLYICGTDEYGTATEVRARDEGVTPRELCDKYHALHQEIYNWFNIKFDIFGRTSTDHFHTEISQDIFNDLSQNGYLEEREIMQLYCPSINRFVADRFIIGTCPKCHDENARGDQCDKCQAIYESTELINPHLKGNSDASLELRPSKHLFLRLDLLQPKIESWFNEVKESWASNAVSITESWLKKGLEPRCITRDMEWGTPLPDNNSKVMYNWFDAPIGYISISGKENIDWWYDQQVRLIQFMGVDNVPFHSILFPGSLIGTNKEYKLVSEIASVHYLNFEGKKFSKTDNIGIFGDEVMKKDIPADYWRYYLMKIRAEDGIGSDGNQRGDANFTWTDFVHSCNADLNKNYGNLIQRTFVCIHKYLNGTVLIPDFDSDFNLKLDKLLNKTKDSYDTNRIGRAIKFLLKACNLTNKLFTDYRPWTRYKKDTNDPEIARSIGMTLYSIYKITLLLSPIIPETTEKILSFINYDNNQITVKSDFQPFFQFIKV